MASTVDTTMPTDADLHAVDVAAATASSSARERLFAQPFVLPCGARLKNRLGKSAMTECLADARTGLPNLLHQTLYRAWSAGGIGFQITGNVMIDRRYREAPRNVILDGEASHTEPEPAFYEWAKACKADPDCIAVMQISHSGRQTPMSVNMEPVAPSPIALNMKAGPKLFKTPRALSSEEIEEIIERFANTAALAQKAGFDGVQIHMAHGYLLSQFLSPLVNQRQDEWGGDATKRRRIAIEVIRRVRSRVSAGFIVGVKLNSSDHQRGGFSEEESMALIQALDSEALDFIEISGGCYESAAMMKPPPQRASSAAREAFFMQFASQVRSKTRIPLMLTGGFRTAEGMNLAIESGSVDLIGIARPVCLEPNLPRELIEGIKDRALQYELPSGPPAMAHILEPSIQNFWHQRQMHLIATNRQPSTEVGVLWAVSGMPFRTYALEWQLVRTSRKLMMLAGAVGLAVVGYYSFFS